MKYYIGFDIGGSRVKAVLVGNKKIIKEAAEDTPDNYQKLLELLKFFFTEMTEGISSEEINGLGVAIAGILDKGRNQILNCPNIKYLNQEPLKKDLSELLNLPVKLEHDVHCFLLAEKETGLIKKMENVFYLTLGTDIGGAWLESGKIYTGSHGAAGEAGHMIIDLLKKNDLGELASNKFIKKALGYGSTEAIEKAQAGDKSAQNVFGQLGRNLGIGLANIINLLDPEAVILAGGVSEAKDFILPGILEKAGELITSPGAKKTPILFSGLGSYGGALGAALLFNQ